MTDYMNAESEILDFDELLNVEKAFFTSKPWQSIYLRELNKDEKHKRDEYRFHCCGVFVKPLSDGKYRRLYLFGDQMLCIHMDFIAMSSSCLANQPLTVQEVFDKTLNLYHEIFSARASA